MTMGNCTLNRSSASNFVIHAALGWSGHIGRYSLQLKIIKIDPLGLTTGLFDLIIGSGRFF